MAAKTKRPMSPEAKEKIRQKMLAKHRLKRIEQARQDGVEPDPDDVSAQAAYENAEAGEAPQQPSPASPPAPVAPVSPTPPAPVAPAPPSDNLVGSGATYGSQDQVPNPSLNPVEAMRQAIPEAFIPANTGIGEAALIEEAAARPKPPEGSNKKVVHFLIDGFTSNGKVWYRGETFAVAVGSPEHVATMDRNGVSWMDLTLDEQMERYERVMFGEGPWPFKTGPDGKEADEEYLAAVTSDDPEALKRYNKRLARKNLTKSSMAAAPGRG